MKSAFGEVVDPGRRKRSRIPDSEIQWVEIPSEEEVGGEISIQVSEEERWKMAEEEEGECAWRRGTEP